MQGEYNISDICNYYIVLQIIILYFKNYNICLGPKARNLKLFSLL